MADDNKFIIEFSADVVDLIQGLGTAENKLEEFGTTGVESINTLKAALSSIKGAANASLDPKQAENFGRVFGIISGVVLQLETNFKKAAAGSNNLNNALDRTKEVAYAAFSAALESGKELETFGKIGVVSISDLTAALKVLKKNAQEATDPQELQAYGQAVAILQNKINQANTTFSRGTDNLNTKLKETNTIVTAAIASTSVAGDKIAEFGKIGNVSIETLNAALKELKILAEQATDPADVKRYGEAYGVVQKTVERASLEFSDAANNVGAVDKSVRKARIAVYGLNQVVRDAPFGFIAISNNIPVLLDQFASLSQTTNGTKAAFRAFGKQLLGPAGISIAISAVIGLVTYAVQKYGSLKNAVNALIKGNGEFILKLEEANKALKKFADSSNNFNQLQRQGAISASEESTQIANLIEVIKNQNTTLDQKKIALTRIKEANKELFEDYDIEKSSVQDLIGLYERYNNLLIAQETGKAFASQIADRNKLIFEQKKLLDEARKSSLTAGRELINAQGKLKNLNDQIIQDENAIVAQLINVEVKQSNLIAKKNEEANIQKTINELQRQNTLDRAGQLQFTLDEIKAQSDVSKYLKENFKTVQRTSDLNKQNQTDISILLAKQKGLKEEIKGVKEFRQSWLDTTIAIENYNVAIAKLKNPKLVATVQANVDEAIARAKEKFASATFEIGRVTFIDLSTKIKEETDKLSKRIANTKIKDTTITVPINAEFQYQQDKIKEQIKNIIDITGKVEDIISQSTVNAFGNFFDGLISGFEEGKTAIDAFGDALVDLGKTIILEVAKLALLEVIKSSLSVATGGGLNIATALLGAGAKGGGLGAATGLAVPGGLAISGNVTFIQRGTDLVGVLNQGNARINRVG